MKNKEAKSIFSPLDNFSSTPPPELWDKIEAQLDKPKKKKRAIIWWWAAACVVAGLSLPTIWYVNLNENNSQELNIENNLNEVVLQNDSKDNENDKKVNGNKSTTPLESKKNDVIENKDENFSTKENRISLANSNSGATKTAATISSKSADSQNVKNSKTHKQNQFIAESDDKLQSDDIVTNKNATAVNNYKSASIIGMNNFYSLSNPKGNPKSIMSITGNTSISETKQNKELVKSSNPKSIQPNQNTIVSSFNGNKAIVENTNTKDSIDIIKKEVAQLENALAALDKDKTKKKTESDVIDKWSLQVFAGVMGSENYNNEKALGNTVASKQSSGYGVKTNYKLNKKWAVSSGFKINELGQKIDGIAYYDRSSLLNFTSDTQPLVQGSPSNNSTIVFVSNNENYLFASNSKANTGFETGNVTQNLKYFEMPLEVSYALLSKKKTNISMNTGGFVGKLISNEVLLNGSSIGENKNVNQYVYGTVLSSTLQYEFYKKTRFFIEPGMNYYINPLENQSFNQFQWMFNIGLNVSF
ncbi:hypothetical protein [Flavobacterium sp. 5]|uniref:hypothetical protein n=1 Tax=Flavobacterium sp. 5 TaxID=2035199 RepID=UPI000C2C18D9|nr:hypothetical protein [Flavobacterium sp. 5]PKB17680.1 hypothetical protein CLU82_2903 [Flavobacterium sp. 5]